MYYLKKALLSNPIKVTFRGYELTLRKDEASRLLMVVKNNKICFNKKL